MKLAIGILIIILVAVVGYFSWEFQNKNETITHSAIFEEREKPLDKYTFDALSKTKFEPSEIELGAELVDSEDFTSRLFFFEDNAMRVSGQINIPDGAGPFPVIVMFRGYVDREVYTIGTGTQRAGEVFVKNGFVTLAPDFLGYGESDEPSGDVMEEPKLPNLKKITTLTITLLKNFMRG